MRPIKPRKRSMHLSSAQRTVIEDEVTQFIALCVVQGRSTKDIRDSTRRKFPNAVGLVVHYQDDKRDFKFKV